jgi:hypothetical protein
MTSSRARRRPPRVGATRTAGRASGGGDAVSGGGGGDASGAAAPALTDDVLAVDVGAGSSLVAELDVVEMWRVVLLVPVPCAAASVGVAPKSAAHRTGTHVRRPAKAPARSSPLAPWSKMRSIVGVLDANSTGRPTLAALDALWSHYANRWSRLFSPGAVTELMLRASFDLETLSVERIANRVPRGTIPDCPSCQDVCCAGEENVVSLRLRDVAVLIDIGRTDLMTRQKPRFGDAMLASRPALRELVASELFQTLPVLRQVGPERRCAALDEALSCTLHPDWPLSCERFPYSLSAVRREVVWGKRCASKHQRPEHAARGDAMFRAAVAVYNERVRDAVLLAHARPALDRLGIGAFLLTEGEDPFEPGAGRGGRLPVLG